MAMDALVGGLVSHVRGLGRLNLAVDRPVALAGRRRAHWLRQYLPRHGRDERQVLAERRPPGGGRHGLGGEEDVRLGEDSLVHLVLREAARAPPSLRTLSPPRRHRFSRFSVRWVSPPVRCYSPPLVPEYVRIPNVFTSALNTRLNTRIYLPTPANCPPRIIIHYLCLLLCLQPRVFRFIHYHCFTAADPPATSVAPPKCHPER